MIPLDANPALGGAASAGVLVLLAIGCVAGLLLYLLPSIIAVRRGHHQVGPIIVVNVLLGGCVGIGWVIALAWSLSAVKRPPPG